MWRSETNVNICLMKINSEWFLLTPHLAAPEQALALFPRPPSSFLLLLCFTLQSSSKAPLSFLLLLCFTSPPLRISCLMPSAPYRPSRLCWLRQEINQRKMWGTYTRLIQYLKPIPVPDPYPIFFPISHPYPTRSLKNPTRQTLVRIQLWTNHAAHATHAINKQTI